MRLYLCFLYCLLPFWGLCQNILKGKITDEHKVSLSYANVVATPISNNGNLIFSITNKKGQYELVLSDSVKYEIAVRSLGYEPHIFSIQLHKETIKNIQLFPAENELTEVVVLEKPPPIITKPDTIVYYVDSFMNGDEHKLRDVLEKLPGVEVTDNGKILVNGKQVKKLLIENKEFFGGNSKLAVKYIPADAINKVEVVDGYSDVAFLEGDELAMNIQLKEDKKQFAFGEVKAGTNTNDRYLIHPDLFYYAPKLNINFIGDANNANLPVFSFMDYFEFSGGFDKLQNNELPPIDKDAFRLFFLEQNIKHSREEFGALNLTYDINDKITSSGYFIISNKFLTHQNETKNQYILTDSLTFEENQTETTYTKNLLGLGKIEVKYDRNAHQNIKYQAFLKFTNAKESRYHTSFSPFQSIDLDQYQNRNNYNFKQALTLHHAFNTNHTGSLILDHQYTQNTPTKNWLITGTLPQNFIPILSDSLLNIFQNQQIQNQRFQGNYRHRWMLTPKNRLDLIYGYLFEQSQLLTHEYQLLSNDVTNSFSDTFGNDLYLKFKHLSFNLRHRFKKRNFEVESGFGLHYINWNNSQMVDLHQQKQFLLPTLKIKKTINNIGEFTINYNMTSHFPEITNLANRFTLIDYNNVFKGNPYLQNTFSHTVGFDFSRMNLLNKTEGYLGLSYVYNPTSIQNQVQFQITNQYISPVLLETPQSQWRGRGSIKKAWKWWSIRPKIEGSRNLNYQNINENNLKMERFQVKYGANILTNFEKLPNIKLKFHQNHNWLFTNKIMTSSFITQKPAIMIKYKFLKTFLFTLESESTILKRTNTTPIHFNLTDLSLSYQSKDKPFGLELEIHNLFNVEQQYQSSFSDFLIIETTTFILPRIILVNATYIF